MADEMTTEIDEKIAEASVATEETPEEPAEEMVVTDEMLDSIADTAIAALQDILQ